MTNTQTKTLAKLTALGGKDIDITYAVPGINRASVEALETQGIVTIRREQVVINEAETDPIYRFRSYPNTFVTIN